MSSFVQGTNQSCEQVAYVVRDLASILHQLVFQRSMYQQFRMYVGAAFLYANACCPCSGSSSRSAILILLLWYGLMADSVCNTNRRSSQLCICYAKRCVRVSCSSTTAPCVCLPIWACIYHSSPFGDKSLDKVFCEHTAKKLMHIPTNDQVSTQQGAATPPFSNIVQICINI